MSNEGMKDEHWKDVEAALDARENPLEIPSIADVLSRDPSARQAITQLVNRLNILSERSAPELAPDSARQNSTRTPLLAAAATLIVFASFAGNHWLRSGDQTPHQRTTRTVNTVTLTIEHTTPPPARGASVDLTSQPVVFWTLEGDPQ